VHSIIIYSDVASPKLNYILKTLLSERFNVEVKLVTDNNQFINHPSPIKLNYSAQHFNNILSIHQSNYFQEFNITKTPKFEAELIFDQSKSNFDIFAASFFLLSRAEEYDNKHLDSHGRFPIEQNSLYKQNIHRKPIVDIWVNSLINALQDKYEISISSKKQYHFLSTIDIDHIYAYQQKPLAIQIGGLIRDLIKLKVGRIGDRFKNKDPYDCIEDLLGWHSDRNLKLKTFVLCAARSDFDKSLNPTHPHYISKIKALSKNSVVGIHPSYYSNEKPQKFKQEKEQLESVIKQKIDSSRQHFLKLNFPSTYQNLIKAGIKADCTMGFAEDVGFRAGTAHPFNWYDIQSDRETDLKVVPFVAMDVTMKQYLKLGAKDAERLLDSMVKEIKSVAGQCCIIWHNSSFYAAEGWQGWKEAYLNILDLCSDKELLS